MEKTIKIEWFDYVREEDKRDLMEHTLLTIAASSLIGVVCGDLSYEAQDETDYKGVWFMSEEKED